MKKIKLFNAVVVGLITIFVLFFIGNTYLMVFSDFMNEFDYLYEEFVFGQYTQFIVMSFSVVTFVGLLYIRKGLQLTLRSGIFNDKSSIDFKFAAKFLLLS